MLGNYKIRVNNESESKEVQELFFELGYKWCDGKRVQYCWMLYLFVDKRGYITMNDNNDDHFLSSKEKEITLPQLRDMVSAHRKPTEQGLISGADALRALADGEDVLWRTKTDAEVKNFRKQPPNIDLVLSGDCNYRFWIKPHTITLNVEIPEIISHHVIGNTMMVNFNNHDDAVKAMEILQGAICKK